MRLITTDHSKCELLSVNATVWELQTELPHCGIYNQTLTSLTCYHSRTLPLHLRGGDGSICGCSKPSCSKYCDRPSSSGFCDSPVDGPESSCLALTCAPTVCGDCLRQSWAGHWESRRSANKLSSEDLESDEPVMRSLVMNSLVTSC